MLGSSSNRMGTSTTSNTTATAATATAATGTTTAATSSGTSSRKIGGGGGGGTGSLGILGGAGMGAGLAAAVGDGSLDTVTEEEKALQQHVADFRHGVQARARTVIHGDLPRKMMHLDALFRDLVPPQHEEHRKYFQDLLEAQLAEHPVAAASSSSSSSNDNKKRKLDEDGSPVSVVYPHQIPSHPIIMESLKKLRAEALELIEMFNTVKIWIQLNIPAIEDGNNFGVSIQEETVSELARAEESCYAVMDAIAKFYATRGKLMTKLIKYPRVQDYIMSAVELDVKECVNLRLCAVDLRNNCAIIYDLIIKNLEKIKKPKNSNLHTMY